MAGKSFMYRLARYAALTPRWLYFTLSGRFDCELPPYGKDVSRSVKHGQLIKYAGTGGISYHNYQGPGLLKQEQTLKLITSYALIAGRLFARFISIRDNKAAGMDFEKIVMALNAKFGMPPYVLDVDGPYLLSGWKIQRSSLVYWLRYDSESSASRSVCFYEPLSPGLSATELLGTWPQP